VVGFTLATQDRDLVPRGSPTIVYYEVDETVGVVSSAARSGSKTTYNLTEPRKPLVHLELDCCRKNCMSTWLDHSSLQTSRRST